MIRIDVGLCQGRHDMPVDEYVFAHTIVDPFNFTLLECEAVGRFRELLGDIKGSECILRLYVSGLTSATIAAVNAARNVGIGCVYVMHYSHADGKYYAQFVRR